MATRRSVWTALIGLPILSGLFGARADAQPQAEAPTGPPGYAMLTIFLRHDQTKTVTEINQHLNENGWFRDFPPPGVEIVSWYVMMGIGQVVTLRFPAERLREINSLVEREAWGGYRTEFYDTYDFRALWKASKERFNSGGH